MRAPVDAVALRVLLAAGVLGLAVAGTACGERVVAHRDVPLRSGGSFKLLQTAALTLKTGEPAEIIEYETDLSLSDLAALRAEVDEIVASWSDLERDIRAVVVKAIEPPAAGWERTRNNHQFLYRRQVAGWVFESDRPGSQHDGDGSDEVREGRSVTEGPVRGDDARW